MPFSTTYKASLTSPKFIPTLGKLFFGHVIASENQGLQNRRKSRFWRFAAICGDLQRFAKLLMQITANY